MTGALPSINANRHILYYTTRADGPLDAKFSGDPKKYIVEKKKEMDPADVSTTSTIRKVFETPNQTGGQDPNIDESLKHDFKMIARAISLKSVPREAYLAGLSGTIPYLATSLSTLYLTWNLKQTWAPGVKSVLMISHENAQALLNSLEPLQLTYGAVIISFLGAIHWGLEFAEKQPSHDRTRFRYGLGVIAPAVAWPTLLMPVEYALMSQFVAFTLLYYADAKAAAKGWAPFWYGTYRFVLTFIVCTAIVASMVGRGKLERSGAQAKLEGVKQQIHTSTSEKYTPKWARLEKEEKEKRHQEEQKNAADEKEGKEGDK